MELIKKEQFEVVKQDWITQSKLTEADFMREVGFALQHVRKSPMLQNCTHASIMTSLVNLARVGLTLNPISKLAALVPRWNNALKENECVLEPMYQGLVKLLTDSGAVTSINAQVVYEGDDFNFDFSEPENMKHKPYFLVGKEKGKIAAVYSKAKIKDGIHVEIMSRADVYEVRERSESYKAYKAEKIKTCIWISDEPEMFRKTVIKRHYKYLPKSTELKQIEDAIELDNQINGYREEIGFGMLQWIESMINSATLNGDEKQKYLTKLQKVQFEGEGFALMKELEEYAPIMGLHSMPQDVKETVEATRNRVDIEDFKERNKTEQ